MRVPVQLLNPAETGPTACYVSQFYDSARGLLAQPEMHSFTFLFLVASMHFLPKDRVKKPLEVSGVISFFWFDILRSKLP